MPIIRFIYVTILATTSQIAATQPAPPKPLDQQIADERRCIAQADATIKNEHEIAREVGIVNKSSLYQAGQMKVACKRRLTYLENCRRTRKCTGLPEDPYAATRPDFSKLDTAEMP